MKAVHFGAGNIGRGFIGLLLARAGYEVIFVDVNEKVVQALQDRGEYVVALADEEGTSETVKGVTAIHGSRLDEVAAAIAGADLVTTAIGVSVLPHIAGVIAEGIKRRLAAGAPQLHVIACENAIGGSTELKRLVVTHLSDEDRAQMEGRVAFPDSAVDRIVPAQHHEDPLKVTVEPFYEWVVNRSAMFENHPVIEGVHYVEALEPFIERKLFTVNTGHCTAAYHGYLKGCETIQQVMADEDLRNKVYLTLKETGGMLVKKYGLDADAHEAYILKILERFTNPHLTDDVRRVGRSPIRKISPNDRLLKPARTAYDLGLSAGHLVEAIVAALSFDISDDPEAVELQQALQERGIREVIRTYMGLTEDHPLFETIAARYESDTASAPAASGKGDH